MKIVEDKFEALMIRVWDQADSQILGNINRASEQFSDHLIPPSRFRENTIDAIYWAADNDPL